MKLQAPGVCAVLILIDIGKQSSTGIILAATYESAYFLTAWATEY